MTTFADLRTFWRVFFYREYPVRPTDRRIIDAGANVGFFTLFAALQAPSAAVASIEAFPATFECLRSMVAANGLVDRVHLFPAALSGTNGSAFIDDNPEIGSQFRRLMTVGLRISSISLESLMTQCRWNQVDLLKIDIEGAEFEVLLQSSDATLQRCSRIVMEFHPRDDEPAYTPEVLIERLRSAGFAIPLRRNDGEGYGIIHAYRQ